MGLTKHQEEELLWAAANAGSGGWLNDALETRCSELSETVNLDVWRRYETLRDLGYIDHAMYADSRAFSARLTEEGRSAAEEVISDRLRIIPKGVANQVKQALASGAVGAAAKLVLSVL